MSLSLYDPGQVLKDAHDPTNAAIKVNVVAASGGGTSTTIADGVSAAILATVLAASTAPVATDKALVVAISPNGTSGVSAAGSTTVGTKTGVNVFDISYVMANAPVRNDYSSVNVTTAAYVTLVASLTAECRAIEIFDSSGQTLVLATGAAAAEVNQFNILPGGNGLVRLRIAAGTRISIKAVSATASVGEIDVNFYG